MELPDRNADRLAEAGSRSAEMVAERKSWFVSMLRI
jgi:hypothetical protein